MSKKFVAIRENILKDEKIIFDEGANHYI